MRRQPVIGLQPDRQPVAAEPARSRMRAAEAWPLAVLGLGSRPTRAILSALGVALGIATMVAVLGISQSSQAQLVAQIDALGTNLLTVTPGQSFSGQNATLPASAPAMVSRIGPVISDSAIGDVNASVYRSDRVSAANTNAIYLLLQPALRPENPPSPAAVGCAPHANSLKTVAECVVR